MEFDEEFRVCRNINNSLEVSQYGRVRKVSNGEILKQTIYKNHLTVEDPQNERPFEWVHRLVAFAWVDEKSYHEGEVVHHINNNGFDNRVDNLVWRKGEDHAFYDHGVQIMSDDEIGYK